MRVVVVVAAMLFCAPVFAQGMNSVIKKIDMELIEIPAGKFTMGSPIGENGRFGSEAQVSVTLTKPFGLGKYEVTQGQWKEVMGTKPWKRQTKTIKGENVAATYVGYFDAVEFCERLTDLEERMSGKLKTDEEYRLPTAAEGEYACRAGTTTAFSFGNDVSQLGEYAWFEGNAGNAGEKYAHKVGMKKPNPWGLYDMHGNVWEWCSDRSDTHLSGGGGMFCLAEIREGRDPSGGTDPVGPSAGSNRVWRGGSSGLAPGVCRSAIRASPKPSDSGSYLGFRVARSQSVQ